MKMSLKSLAVAIATVLGGAGTASAQQWAPAGYQPPAAAANPYFAGAQTIAAQASPSDVVSGACTDKAGAFGLGDGSCSDCDDCRDPSGVWGGVEFIFLFPKGRRLPPLVTTSPAGTPQGNAGVLPGATILFGNDTIGEDFQPAGRATLGKWFDEGESIGAGIRFFGMAGSDAGFTTDSTATPIIGRPFFNIDPLVNAQDALLVAYPGLATGTINVATSSALYQADALLRVNLDYGSNHRLDVIGGYQFTRLDDGVTVDSLSTIVGGNLPVGSTFAFRDSFDAKNEFHGGSLGLIYEHCRGPWMLSGLAKFSVGQMNETVTIAGTNTVQIGGIPATTEGGLLAQTTNIGVYKRRETAFVPELAINLNRRITDHLDFTVGYSIIYFSSVVLAGDQIDMTVNGSQLTGGALVGDPRPTFLGFNDGDYFVHGLSLGLGFHF